MLACITLQDVDARLLQCAEVIKEPLPWDALKVLRMVKGHFNSVLRDVWHNNKRILEARDTLEQCCKLANRPRGDMRDAAIRAATAINQLLELISVPPQAHGMGLAVMQTN